MKYVPGIVALLLWCHCTAQTFHKCYVYQYYGNDSGSKALVLTRIFNDKGKVVHEMSGHYINYESIGGKNTSNIKEDGIYDYYYDDTLLTVMMKINPKEHKDSDRVFYYYNAKKQLVRQRTQHHKPDSSEIFYDQEHDMWQVLIPNDDTLLFSYDQGRLVEKDKINVDTTHEYFVYDDSGRLMEDRYINTRSNFESYRKTYKYEGKSYKEYCRFYNHVEFPSITEFETDELNRVVEERHFFSLYEEGGKPGEQYKLLNKTVLRYNSNGQIAARMYYRGDKLTTTHVFVYE